MSKIKTVEQALMYGRKLAETLSGTKTDADRTMRLKVLEAAAEVSHDQALTKATLDGVKEFYIAKGVNPAVATARKSEIKAIFDAVIADASNLAELQEYTGGWHEFIVRARGLRGTIATSKPRAPRKPGLTANQFGKVEEAIDKALPADLESIVQVASTKMIATPNTVVNLPGLQSLRAIRTICLAAARSETIEASVKKILGEVFLIVNAPIGAMEKANQDTARMLGKKVRDGAKPAAAVAVEEEEEEEVEVEAVAA